MARDFLSASPYTSLLVEIDYVQGEAPDQAALNLVQTRLNERCNKPGGITIKVDNAIPTPARSTWSLADVQGLERQYRNSYSSGNTAVAR